MSKYEEVFLFAVYAYTLTVIPLTIQPAFEQPIF